MADRDGSRSSLWKNYLRNEDAERMGIKRSYRNLEEYFKWKKRQEKKKK